MSKKPKHWFQFVSAAVFVFFMSIMIYAAYIAFERKSGMTQLDVTKIQKLRYEATHASSLSTEISEK